MQKPARQCHINTAAKFPKFCAAVEPFLLAFPISYMLESGVSHANAFLKQKNRLNSEERGDFATKHIRLQLDENALAVSHRKHPFH